MVIWLLLKFEGSILVFFGGDGEDIREVVFFIYIGS